MQYCSIYFVILQYCSIFASSNGDNVITVAKKQKFKVINNSTFILNFKYMTSDEIWKNVPGYDKYYISNYGRVKNLDYKRSGREVIMLPGRIRNGYIVVVLSQNAVRKTYLLHRLVAEAFIPNPNNNPQVNHKDGDKTNNHISNLEWVTRKENVRHSFEKLGRIGSKPCLGKKGELCPLSKSVIQMQNGVVVAEYSSIKEAYERTRVPSDSISKCCKGERDVAGGYEWKFKSPPTI